MKRMYKTKTHTSFLKARGIYKLVIWLALIGIFSFSCASYIHAKYYTKGYSKGMASASGFYFESDCLRILDDSSSEIEDITKDTTDFAIFPEYINADNVSNTNQYVFNINIKNYENQLLYNEGNLDITYDVYIRLRDANVTTGVSYSVTYPTDDVDNPTASKDILPGATTTINSLSLKGGRADSDMIKVTVALANESIGIDSFSEIAVWAIPSAPDYLAGSVKLGARLKITENSSVFSYDNKFAIESSLTPDGWADENKTNQKILGGMAAFQYNISITGNPPEDKKWLKITWNTNYLEINQYDSNYQSALADQTMTRTGKDAAAHTEFMIVKLEAYAYIQMAFYKAETFDETNINSLEGLRGLVSCEYYTAP